MVLVYLAGPMTGIEGLNKALFHHAAGMLEHPGIKVINPANIEDDGVEYESLVRVGEFHATIADYTVMLPGWEESTGATREKAAAETAGKMVVLWEYVESRFYTLPEKVLEYAMHPMPAFKTAVELPKKGFKRQFKHDRHGAGFKPVFRRGWR